MGKIILEPIVCNSCGYNIVGYDEDDKLCPVCNSEMICPDINPVAFSNMYGTQEKEAYLKALRNNEELDPALVAKRIAYEAEQNSKSKNSTPSYSKPSKPQIECPYCHSINTSKIGTTGRFFSTLMLGVGGKVGKQWHCNRCKSDF